jgi:hypothetical protein
MGVVWVLLEISSIAFVVFFLGSGYDGYSGF